MLKRLGPEIKLLKHPLRHSEASNPETNVDLRETARLFLLFGKSAAMLLQPVCGEDPDLDKFAAAFAVRLLTGHLRNQSGKGCLPIPGGGDEQPPSRS